MIPHLGLNTTIHFPDNRAYLEHVLGTRTHDRGLCVVVAPWEGEVNATDPAWTTRFAAGVRETLHRCDTTPG